jgi:hypothetical protein
MNSLHQRAILVGFAIIFAVFVLILFAPVLPTVKEYGVPYGNYPGLILAMISGAFGASFSMLVQTQRRGSEGTLEDIRTAGNWKTLLIRSAFGFGAASILYFFFNSGLLEGSLWPKLDGIKFSSPVPSRDLCLLVIWSFVAGFSENFVPNILVKTEQRSDKP